MVVFTCNHCGESLQKPRVEKHYGTQCRRPKSLTCVDCFKDFKDEEYVVHTKCITEEERYAAKGSIPGGIVKKGDVKQESWTDMIRSIVQSEQDLKPSLRNLFNTLSTYTNVPRKKAKFINFLKSSTGGRVNFADIESAWDLIEKYKNDSTQNDHKVDAVKENGAKHKLDENGDGPAKKVKKELETESNEMSTKKKKKAKDESQTEANEGSDEVPAKKKKKGKDELQVQSDQAENGTKHKSDENGDGPVKKMKELETESNGMSTKKKKKAKDESHTEANEGSDEVPAKKKKKEKDGVQSDQAENEPSIFSFKGTILKILNSKGSISCTKLQKKVLSAYSKETGNAEYTEKTIKKYNQKLKKLPNVTINNDVVSLQVQ